MQVLNAITANQVTIALKILSLMHKIRRILNIEV